MSEAEILEFDDGDGPRTTPGLHQKPVKNAAIALICVALTACSSDPKKVELRSEMNDFVSVCKQSPRSHGFVYSREEWMNLPPEMQYQLESPEVYCARKFRRATKGFAK